MRNHSKQALMLLRHSWNTRNYDLDCGSQFMNATLEGLTTILGVRRHSTIPYSNEENGIVSEQGSKPPHSEHLLASNTLHDGKAAELVRKRT